MAFAKNLSSVLIKLSKQGCLTRAFLTTTTRGYQNVQSSGVDSTIISNSEENGEHLVTGDGLALETPLMTSRDLRFPVNHTYPRLSWVESMNSLQGTKLGMVDLHPDVFAVYPRIDIITKNVHWQKFYRHIDYSFEPSRAEMPGGGRKPWPQKGLGKARHGSVRSPLWHKGAKAHGPRGPKSYFFMLSKSQRGLGLRSTLSCKFAQNDLVIVDSFDIPTSDPDYISELADVRFWGYSILFVDDVDMVPENMAMAVRKLRGFNLMPVYGLNVYSMLKHETLVLTLAALEKLENKLLDEMHSQENESKFVNRIRPEDFYTEPKEDTIMLKKFSAPF